jgi:hypothetical protein
MPWVNPQASDAEELVTVHVAACNWLSWHHRCEPSRFSRLPHVLWQELLVAEDTTAHLEVCDGHDMVLHVRHHLPGSGSTQDNSDSVHGLTHSACRICWR